MKLTTSSGIFNTAWKVPNDGVFSGPYFPVFELNIGIQENTDQKKLHIWTLSKQQLIVV